MISAAGFPFSCRLARDLFSRVSLDVYVSYTLDMRLFASDCIGDPLRALELFLAHRNLARLDGLLGRRHLLLTDRHAEDLALLNRTIRRLSRTGTPLDMVKAGT